MLQMQVFIYCKITLYFSGVYHTHHQEYIKLQLPLLVQVMSPIRATNCCQRGLLRVTVCGIMQLPRCCRPVAGNIAGHYTTNCNTQSSAPEDG